MYSKGQPGCPSPAAQHGEPPNWNAHALGGGRSQGGKPSKKVTKISDVKLYLKDVVIPIDGLLIVKDHPPFQTAPERVAVPLSVLKVY